MIAVQVIALDEAGLKRIEALFEATVRQRRNPRRRPMCKRRWFKAVREYFRDNSMSAELGAQN